MTKKTKSISGNFGMLCLLPLTDRKKCTSEESAAANEQHGSGAAKHAQQLLFHHATVHQHLSKYIFVQ